MIKEESLSEVLVKVFGPSREKIVTGWAPGRVNLIGEHTDYNEGFVFPIAIGYGIELAARLRQDSFVRIYSCNFIEMAEFNLDNSLRTDPIFSWSNYIRGVLWAFQKKGIALNGLEIVFRGDLPQGGGLSSSAALEVVTAVVLQKLLGFTMGQIELALLCQQAENDFVGTQCGIMDQFISLMGEENQALFLDCRSLEFKHIPLDLGDYRILICNSGVKHSLVTSEYNQRRQDCQNGVEILQRHFQGIKTLRDVRLEQLKQCRQDLGERIYRRCHHVITENDRVLKSIQAIGESNWEQFGQLLNVSHDSLKNDYEVSCPEIDLLVNLARQVPGVLGARITGGGFGGCTVNLVASQSITAFTEAVVNIYQLRTGISPFLLICTPFQGARII